MVYTDFKNASNDIVVDTLSVQTSYPNGSVVITEANYTQIVFNDENQTTESCSHSYGEKATLWTDGECKYYKNVRISSNYQIFLQAICNNGLKLFHYGAQNWP